MKNGSTLGTFIVGVAMLAATVVGFLQWMRIQALEAGQQQVLSQLQEMTVMLQGGAAGARTAEAPPITAPAEAPLPETVRTAGAPALGKADARVVMVEFSDFECPFCGRFTAQTFPQLKAEYIDTGKIRYVFRNFPLEQIHPRAMKSAQAAECAHQQGKFWPMHDRLFTNQQALGDADLDAHAKAVGLNTSAFGQCLPGTVGKIRSDLDEGSRGGISGTPGFFIGTTGADGNLRVLKRIVGAQPYANFKSALDEALNTL